MEDDFEDDFEDFYGDFHIINSEHKLEYFIQRLRKEWKEAGYIRAKIQKGKQRTDRQNRAVHQFFKMVAKALNDGGIDQRIFLKESIPIDWDGKDIKKRVWKPLQDAILGQDSTADCDTKDYTKVYEYLNRHLANKYGIHVPWPDKHEKEKVQGVR